MKMLKINDISEELVALSQDQSNKKVMEIVIV
jgi:hypothetical protein